uniref:Uncharacterized protein n=1 Tax=viral metagenome TaxID=1070528 RepID=A0A6C0CK57_9ZZZZ
MDVMFIIIDTGKSIILLQVMRKLKGVEIHDNVTCLRFENNRVFVWDYNDRIITKIYFESFGYLFIPCTLTPLTDYHLTHFAKYIGATIINKNKGGIVRFWN